MISDNQLEANRTNAQLSTGPRTDAGKQRSSLNARRHGLTGQVSSMTEEDRAAHDKFAKSLIDDLKPEGAMETQLAQRIATDSWRLNRLSAIEDNIYALGFDQNAGLCPTHGQIDAAFGQAVTFTQQSAELQRLSLYEQRLNRTIQKNLALLKQLQTTRKAESEARMEEAKLLLKLNESKGITYEPQLSAQDEGPLCEQEKAGFVFSTSQIRSFIDRDQRLNDSRNLGSGPRNPGKLRTLAA